MSPVVYVLSPVPQSVVATVPTIAEASTPGDIQFAPSDISINHFLCVSVIAPLASPLIVCDDVVRSVETPDPELMV